MRLPISNQQQGPISHRLTTIHLWQTDRQTDWQTDENRARDALYSLAVARENRFDCRAAVCLPCDVKKCLWIQEATGEVCIRLEHNIIDTAVNE